MLAVNKLTRLVLEPKNRLFQFANITISNNLASLPLFVPVCVERMPVLTCDMNEIEKRYYNYINKVNIQKSLLSNHELRKQKDM